MRKYFTISVLCLAICISVSANQLFRKIQTGKASWYGKQFNGKETASGERFDMYGFTAAHRTLPFGTLVKVTNLKNGYSVVVRINDRGPNLQDRIIDLSYGAAKAIGLSGYGVLKVKIEII